MEEIDSQNAIGRLGGFVSLYRELLENFRSDLKTIPSEYRSYIRATEIEKAIRLIHTLKGTSATVGAMALSRFASELEEYCRTHSKLNESSSRADELINKIDSTDATNS